MSLSQGWQLYQQRLLEARLTALRQATMEGETEYKKGFYHGLKRAAELAKWMMLEAGKLTNQGDLPDEGPNEEEMENV